MIFKVSFCYIRSYGLQLQSYCNGDKSLAPSTSTDNKRFVTLNDNINGI